MIISDSVGVALPSLRGTSIFASVLQEYVNLYFELNVTESAAVFALAFPSASEIVKHVTYIDMKFAFIVIIMRFQDVVFYT